MEITTWKPLRCIPSWGELYFPPTGAWDRPTLIGDHKKLAGALDVAKQPTRGYAITDLQARENGEALMRSLGME